MEPDLVERMRSGGLSDGHFAYGPSFPGVFREPFSNERHLFSDSQLHCCEPYLELEKKFFNDNAAIVRENYFGPDLLLGIDPAEDLVVEEAVDYDDLVPATRLRRFCGKLLLWITLRASKMKKLRSG